MSFRAARGPGNGGTASHKTDSADSNAWILDLGPIGRERATSLVTDPAIMAAITIMRVLMHRSARESDMNATVVTSAIASIARIGFARPFG